jgi:hypothetical protein
MPQSKIWRGGTKQEHDAWCWAAATQALLRAFGLEYPQERIVHDWLVSDAALRADNEEDDYFTQCQLRTALAGGDDLSYTSFLALPAKDVAELRAISSTWWGNTVPVANYTQHALTPVPDARRTFAAAQAILDRPGLILMAGDNHWRIVTGYQAGQAGLLSVWDPANGGTELEDVPTAVMITPTWFEIS